MPLGMMPANAYPLMHSILSKYTIEGKRVKHRSCEISPCSSAWCWLSAAAATEPTTLKTPSSIQWPSRLCSSGMASLLPMLPLRC